MISLLQRAEIRRLFYAEHWPVGTIADALGVHHETVRRAINRARGIHPGPQIRPASWIPTRRSSPRRSSSTRACAPRALLRHAARAGLPRLGRPGPPLRPHRPPRGAAPRRSSGSTRLVAEQGQVDWGNFGAIQIGAARRVLSCFVLVLSWSRAVYARFALDQTLESFLRGHVEAFAALGGVPRTLLYDNLKSVVLERFGEHIRFHPRLLELAGHYHFAPQPCAVARGNEKTQASYCSSFRTRDAHWG